MLKKPFHEKQRQTRGPHPWNSVDFNHRIERNITRPQKGHTGTPMFPTGNEDVQQGNRRPPARSNVFYRMLKHMQPHMIKAMEKHRQFFDGIPVV